MHTLKNLPRRIGLLVCYYRRIVVKKYRFFKILTLLVGNIGCYTQQNIADVLVGGFLHYCTEISDCKWKTVAVESPVIHCVWRCLFFS